MHCVILIKNKSQSFTFPLGVRSRRIGSRTRRGVVLAAVLTAVLALLPARAFLQTSPGGVLSSAACRVWVDAGDVNGDGDYTNNPAVNTAVPSWEDKSGNNNDLTQGTSTNQPVYNTVAGRGVVQFDNTGTNVQWLNATTQTTLNPGTMYFVIRMVDAGDGGNCLWDRPGAGNTSVRFEQWNGTNVLGYSKYGTADYSTTVTSTYGANLVVSYLKTSASDNLDIAVNSTSTNLVVGSTNPGLPLYILGKNSTLDGINGYVLEALCYNTNLNYAQKMIVDNYLSAKHGGITIISDKYVGDIAGNGHYDFEMGGVGTEPSGNNNQASASITGGLEATQATAMGNGEYLMYGHQSTPTNSVNTADVGGMSGAGTKGRWERIWYFDWTHIGGSNESVNLVFDYSDAGVGGSPAGATTNYKLLFRAGTSGNWTEVMNSTSIAGDRVTFNGVVYNTAGDGYYTLGSINTAASPLPVELTSFNARTCGNEVCVSWSTLTERNTNLFRVERSAEGKEWTTASEVDAAGNSREPLYYETFDHAPLPGLSYYRLSIIDHDGSNRFSKLVAVTLDQPGPTVVPIPNPAGTEVEFKISGSDLSAVNFVLLGSDGRLWGIEPFLVTSNRYRFDVSAFPRGVYLVVATLPNGTRLTRKLVLN